MRFSRFFAWLFMCWPLLLAPAWSVAQPKQAKAPHIEPQAAQVLKHMTEYLKGLSSFPSRPRSPRTCCSTPA